MANFQILHHKQLSGHRSSIYTLTPGLKEGSFLSGSGDGWIVEWELATPDTGKLIAQVDRQIFSLLALKQEGIILAGNMEGFLNWAVIDDADASRRIMAHPGGIFGIQQRKGFIYTLGGDGVLGKWDKAEKRLLESLSLSSQSLRCISFHPKLALMAVGASDGNIYIVDENDFALKYVQEAAHSNSVFSAAFSPDGHILLSGGRDAQLKSWNTHIFPMTLVNAINAHWYTINDIIWHPHYNVFATGSRDKTIKIWSGKKLELLKVLETVRDNGHAHSVNTLLWSRGGDTLISAGDDKSIILWNCQFPLVKS